MSNKESNIEKTNFDAFIQAVGSEIEQAQVRLIVAANAQMLFHYWKIGNYILYHQQLHGWGSKIIKQWQRLSDCITLKRKAIRNVTLPICASLQKHIL
ncbi:DUF1016 N-terminal domain protein [Bacteroides thetaiotaomicron]|nr:DUF1016 N-terminal domain protein [Bacteroides thetaiotaomicron]